MPREMRTFSSSKTYHNILKGIDDQTIFYDEQDRRIFLKQLLETKKEYGFTVHAYCLMGNHVHLVMRCDNPILSKAMQSLQIRYVRYFNKKYMRIGTLFRDRFRSKKVEDLEYFLEVCRYVHRNPEKAGIELTQNYKWSSYQEYLGQGKRKIIDKNVLLHYFNNSLDEFINYTLKKTLSKDLDDYADYEIINRLTDDELAEIIVQKLDIKKVTKIGAYFNKLSDKKLAENIEKIKNISGTNITQLARVTRVNRRRIKEACQEKHRHQIDNNVKKNTAPKLTQKCNINVI